MEIVHVGEDVENKKPSNSGKAENEGIQQTWRKQFERAASSFSLRRSAPNSGADEHSQIGILTSASDRLPAFPIFGPVALGICSRYSGATVPDSHRVP
jgi:hypothetical protein